MKLSLVLACLLAGGTGSAAELVELSRIRVADGGDFGGMSALEVSDDGESYVAVSDRGMFAEGRLLRRNGRLSGASVERLQHLRSNVGGYVKGFKIDSEGLAIDRDGNVYISFEGFHRVWLYKDIGGEPAWTHKWDYYWHLQGNSGMESLAVDADGTVYAIPERSGKWTRPFPVFRYRRGKWIKSLSIPRSGKFLPAGADFGPDGKLYLVERDFTWVGGFSTRVRRFSLGPGGFDGGETLLVSAPGDYDNLEGISAWRDGDGAIRLTAISDDNFNPLQDTEIVEFRVVE